MSHTELDHLCFAALKNAQSYDLFWTVEIQKLYINKILFLIIRFLIYV